MIKSLRIHRKRLEEEKVINRDDVIKLENITQDKFITESISLDKFSKSRTTLYVNDIKNLIDRKLEEYSFLEETNNSRPINLLDKINAVLSDVKSIKNMITSEEFKNKIKIISEIKFQKYDEQSKSFVDYDENTSLSSIILDNKVLIEMLNINAEDFNVTLDKSDAFIKAVLNYKQSSYNSSELIYLSNYQLTLKDFKEYFITKPDDFIQALDFIYNNLNELIKEMLTPGNVYNYTMLIENNLNKIDKVHKFLNKRFFLNVILNIK